MRWQQKSRPEPIARQQAEQKDIVADVEEQSLHSPYNLFQCRFTARCNADATRREAEQRERAIMLENKLLASEQAREADRRQAETVALINGQFCQLNGRISNVECNMPRTTPCYIPAQPVATFACGPRPANGCCNG